MTKPVGFDQKILLTQLDFTAKNVRTHNRKEMYELLDGFIRNDVTGVKARKNVITILLKSWYLVEDEHVPLRDFIVDEFDNLTQEERLLAHFGMLLLAYPFFKDVILEFGRAFKLQDTVSTTTIKKRIKEDYGDRRRVDVAVSAVLTTLKVWGLIISVKQNELKLADKIAINNPHMQRFIIEVLLKVLNHEALPIEVLQNHIIFFPFQYDFDLFELRQKKELNFHQQGIDNLIVEVKAI